MVALHIDNEVIHQGLVAMLSSAPTRYEIVSCNSVGDEPPQKPAKLPEVIILAFDDEQSDDIEDVAKRFGEAGTKVLLLLTRSDESLFDRAAQVLTDGFLVLDQMTTEILDESLQKAASGDVVIPPSIAGRLLARRRNGQSQPRLVLPELTPRERQALQLLVGGLSNKQIAARLRISQHGAKRLVANLLAKLNCRNRTMAASMALQYKLVEQDASTHQ
ncbi:response regulator transcription factor [Nocardiopsis sp. NRRL B-16309]|uniref:LuxR C-terminal-related transcriptional regulator n=1 Tax=Nocardiopsis sp. NRRL B-16309 TaxID=1519494 RepID=UPI0006AE8FF7|nr:response regulator transcription factor [Nocardiopsis sp. NRRL B-16309]